MIPVCLWNRAVLSKAPGRSHGLREAKRSTPVRTVALSESSLRGIVTHMPRAGHIETVVERSAPGLNPPHLSRKATYCKTAAEACISIVQAYWHANR